MPMLLNLYAPIAICNLNPFFNYRIYAFEFVYINYKIYITWFWFLAMGYCCFNSYVLQMREYIIRICYILNYGI